MPVISNKTSRAAATLGRIGGTRKSDAKQIAAQANAVRGWQGEAGARRRLAIAARKASKGQV